MNKSAFVKFKEESINYNKKINKVLLRETFFSNHKFLLYKTALMLFAFAFSALTLAYFPLSQSQIDYVGLNNETTQYVQIYPQSSISQYGYNPSSFLAPDESYDYSKLESKNEFFDFDNLMNFLVLDDNGSKLIIASYPFTNENLNTFYKVKSEYSTIEINNNKIQINGTDYNVEDNSEILFSALPYHLQNYINANEDVLFTSNEFYEDLFISGDIFKITNKLGNDISPDLSCLVTKTRTTRNESIMLYNYESIKNENLSTLEVEIVSDDNILVVPGFQKGENISSSGLYNLTISDASQANDKIIISYKTFFLISMANSIQDNDYEQLYYFKTFMNKNNIMGGAFYDSGFNYIYPYLVNGAILGNILNRNDLFYILLAISIVLILVSALTSMFGQKQLYRQFQNMSKVVEYNGINRKHLTILNVSVSLIPPLVCFALGALLYSFLFIPLSNYTMYLFGFQNSATIANGSLYYSATNFNYSNIQNILVFYQIHYIHLLVLLALCLIFFALTYFKNRSVMKKEKIILNKDRKAHQKIEKN
jgi:hypothetical protein